jgi:hypothetical protein
MNKKTIIILVIAIVLTSNLLLAQERYKDSRFGVQGAIVNFPDEMKEAGIEITRDWIDWQDMEPVKGQYNWAPMDKKVKAANQAGIEILGYFVHMPAWAKKGEKDSKASVSMSKKYPLKEKYKKSKKFPLSDKKATTSDFCEPKDINDFRRFAKAVAERYNGKNGYGQMKYIGILNEVTIPEFFDFKNADYVLWLVNGYEAVKQGNPDAKVLIGSFVDPLFFLGSKPDPVAQAFIDKMLGNYSQYYDIVDFHSYSHSDAGMAETTQYIKERTEFYNVNKPMWITETATLILNFTEQDWQNRLAQSVIKRYVLAFGGGVEKVFWFPFVGLPTPDEDPSSTTNKIIALGWAFKNSQTYHERPAYNAYKIMTSKLAGFTSVKKITDTQHKFIVNEKSIYVLWCDSESCSLPSEIIGTVKLTDYLGNAEIKNANQITLGESPVFVEEE